MVRQMKFLLPHLLALLVSVDGFVAPQIKLKLHPLSTVRFSTEDDGAPSDSADYSYEDYAPGPPETETTVAEGNNEQRDFLKKKLLQLGASYDRGFGASASARVQVEKVLEELEQLNPESFAARGIKGGINYGDQSPLEGSWRMVWCSAQDVLVLNASPLATVGAIYQIFSPPVVTNVIDFIPRVESLFPPTLIEPSVLRAKVTTQASPRTDGPSPENRVGLSFEKVELKPMQLWGKALDLPPFGFDLPKLPNNQILNPETGPGYFDVSYLDDELLVIRQNDPGGMFALVKVNDSEP